MAETSEPLPEQPAGPPGKPPRDGEAREPHGALEHPSIQYERRDVPFRWVLIIAVDGTCIGAAIFGLVYVFFRADTERLATRRESEFPLAEHLSNTLPANPRLEQVDRIEGIPDENVYLSLSAKEDQLQLYGDTNEKGFVHIPIRRAIETLDGHLPVRKQPTGPAKDNGLVDSGASNSGRMLRGSPQ
jgi:hypothetical protein